MLNDFKWGVLEQGVNDGTLGGGSLLQKYSQTFGIYWQTNPPDHHVLTGRMKLGQTLDIGRLVRWLNLSPLKRHINL